MICKRIALITARELTAGASPDQAAQTAMLEVSAEFGGERVYIASLPKAQRAQQIAKLQRQSAREVAAATGMSVRTVHWLRSGK